MERMAKVADEELQHMMEKLGDADLQELRRRDVSEAAIQKTLAPKERKSRDGN
jgi:hypothetical protein